MWMAGKKELFITSYILATKLGGPSTLTHQLMSKVTD